MSLKNGGSDELSLEITVLSADSLHRSGRLRPYVTLSPYTHTCCTQLYRTLVAITGTHNSPAWNDTLSLPVDPTSFLLRRDDSASVQVSLLSQRKGLLRHLGPTELGWCLVRPSDVVDGLRPPGAPRRISYALRSGRHGGRGRGVVHLSVRLVGPALDRLVGPPHPPPLPLDHHHQIPQGWVGPVAMGIPVGPEFQAPDYWAGEVLTKCRKRKSWESQPTVPKWTTTG